MESNAFKTEFLAAAVGLGLVAMAALIALDPFGTPVVLASWSLVLGGLMLSVAPGRPRAVGFGLAIAGAIPPFVLFLCAWIILSVAALGGTLS